MNHSSRATDFRMPWRAALASGASASLASTAALAACGKAEIDDAAAPINGPSQWIWGRYAKYCDGFTLRHTLVGYAVHHFASTLWAFLFEGLRRGPLRGRDPTAALVTSGAAALVDFRFTPQRFTPGFEKRLSRRSLVAVYLVFALGLVLAARSGSQIPPESG